MIPKIENPFEVAEDGEFYTPELNVDFVPVKGELDEL